MTADQYEQLAVKAARIAEKSTGAAALRWWARAEAYETAADQARTAEETR